MKTLEGTLEVQQNVSLQGLNTFGLDARCEYYARVTDAVTLPAFLRHSGVQGLRKFVLGGGSNMLLVDDIQGLVVHNAILGRRILREDAESVLLAVGGGEVWHELVLYTLSQGWGGLENLSLIPGNVGAAPIQNIGAYGVEIREVFSHLTAIDLQTGEARVFHKDECAFGYRDSIFKRELWGRYMITEVVFALRKAPHRLNMDYGAIRDELSKEGIVAPTIRDVSNAVIAIRRSKLPDPAEIGNAGSFFKNPEIPRAQYEGLKAVFPAMPSYVVDESTLKIPAGWLIEQAGWKGKRLGNYGVHAQQALVLVNYGGANGRDILALSEAIMQDILERFGIVLEREVNVVGSLEFRV